MFDSAGLLARLFRGLLLSALSIVIPSSLFAEETVLEGLQSCATLDDAALRLACYDKLGEQRDKEQDVAVDTPAIPPDDLGAGSLRRDDKEETEELAVVAKVNRCSKNSRKKFLFYLEGGQVWKQLSDRRLPFKECEFNVTISKDFFGYKMQVEGEKSRFRVSRVR